jgi:RimJ/RimL family protein N-acetyltransferase
VTGTPAASLTAPRRGSIARMTDVVATGELVRLRVPGVGDVDLLDAWEASPDALGEFNDFGQPPHGHREAVEKGTVVDENHGTLLVERVNDGVPVGTVSWRPAFHGPPPESRGWALGISLAPEGRGQGYGSEALRLVAAYLFAATTANRIEGETDIENVAGQRALERAGFAREGVLRGAQWRRGAYHDLVVYGRVRGD